MTKYGITSDWHLYHNNILTFCQRLDVMTEEERVRAIELGPNNRAEKIKYSDGTIRRMVDAVVDGVNSVLGPDDVLWNLGDVMFGPNNIDHFYALLMEFRQRIKCRTINLVWGNHDQKLQWWRNKGGKQKALTKEQFYTVFNEAHWKFPIKVNGQKIILDHTANAVWIYNHKGAWHCYGHSHGNFEETREKLFPGAKMIDSGIDNAHRMGYGYTPFIVEGNLKKFMDAQEGLVLDHHGAR